MLHVQRVTSRTKDHRTWRARELDRRREDYHRTRWTEEPVVDTALPDPDRLANWQSPWTVRRTGHPTSAVNKASVGGTKLLCILFFLASPSRPRTRLHREPPSLCRRTPPPPPPPIYSHKIFDVSEVRIQRSVETAAHLWMGFNFRRGVVEGG